MSSTSSGVLSKTSQRASLQMRPQLPIKLITWRIRITVVRATTKTWWCRPTWQYPPRTVQIRTRLQEDPHPRRNRLTWWLEVNLLRTKSRLCLVTRVDISTTKESPMLQLLESKLGSRVVPSQELEVSHYQWTHMASVFLWLRLRVTHNISTLPFSRTNLRLQLRVRSMEGRIRHNWTWTAYTRKLSRPWASNRCKHRKE
jgi:hypothetical protein